MYGKDRGMGDIKGDGGNWEDPPRFGLFLSGVNSFRLDELTFPPLSGVSGISPIFPGVDITTLRRPGVLKRPEPLIGVPPTRLGVRKMFRTVG